MKRLLTTGWIVAAAILPCALHAADFAPARPSSTREHVLDLNAPDMRRIYSPEEIEAALRRAADSSLEHVHVEALRLGDLMLEDNSASLAENIARTVAWLLMPAATFGAVEQQTIDASDSHRPPPFMQALHHHAGVDRL